MHRTYRLWHAKIVRIVLATLFLTLFVPVVFSDVVLHMPFDHYVEDGVEKTHDFSGYNNHGNVSGAVYNETAGVLGSAYWFDGVDDFIIGNSPYQLYGYKNWTLSFWMKYYSVPSRATILLIKDRYSECNRYFHWLMYNDYSQFGYWNCPWTGTSNGQVGFDLSPYLERWMFLSTVYDAQSREVSVYINATFVGKDFAYNKPYLASETFIIGRRLSISESHFKGIIDEIKIYNISMSEEEIKDEFLRYLDEGFDRDHDGFWAYFGDDCNDSNPEIHPNATEFCDTIDNDCDSLIDEEIFESESCGFGVCSGTKERFCSDGSFSEWSDCSTVHTQCADDLPEFGCPFGNDPASDTGIRRQSFKCNARGECESFTNPWYIDEDCNDTTFCFWDTLGNDDANYYCTPYLQCLDNDRDGYFALDPLFCPLSDDCNDNDGNIFPDQEEYCDLMDNNCNGEIDEHLDQIRSCGSNSCSGSSERACSTGLWQEWTPCNSTGRVCGNEFIEFGCPFGSDYSDDTGMRGHSFYCDYEGICVEHISDWAIDEDCPDAEFCVSEGQTDEETYCGNSMQCSDDGVLYDGKLCINSTFIPCVQDIAGTTLENHCCAYKKKEYVWTALPELEQEGLLTEECFDNIDNDCTGVVDCEEAFCAGTGLPMDYDHSLCYCEKFLQGDQSLCDEEGESGCWVAYSSENTLVGSGRCCGDDGDETWTYTTNMNIQDIIVPGTCFQGRWATTIGYYSIEVLG